MQQSDACQSADPSGCAYRDSGISGSLGNHRFKLAAGLEPGYFVGYPVITDIAGPVGFRDSVCYRLHPSANVGGCDDLAGNEPVSTPWHRFSPRFYCTACEAVSAGGQASLRRAPGRAADFSFSSSVRRLRLVDIIYIVHYTSSSAVTSMRLTNWPRASPTARRDTPQVLDASLLSGNGPRIAYCAGAHAWSGFMKKNKCELLALSLIAMLFAATVQAAPVAPADDAQPTGAAGMDSAGARILDQAATAAMPGAARPGTSRALDLLIEMQGNSAGLDFSASTRALDRSARAMPPSGAPERRQTPLPAPVVDSSSGLFGSGAAPAVVTKGRAGGDTDWKSAATRTGSAPGADRADFAEGDVHQVRAPLLQLPRVVMRWMRDNRMFVVGAAVALLALLWGTSFVFSQRRR